MIQLSELDAQLQEAEKKNKAQADALFIAREAVVEAERASKKLSDLNEKVKIERSKLDNILLQAEEVQARKNQQQASFEQLTLGAQKAHQEHVESVKAHNEAKELKEALEAQVLTLQEELKRLTASCEGLAFSEEQKKKENANLDEVKQSLKRNISIFLSRTEGTDNQKAILKASCEEDEEVRARHLTSKPDQPLYYIAKKSDGQPDPNFVLDP